MSELGHNGTHHLKMYSVLATLEPRLIYVIITFGDFGPLLIKRLIHFMVLAFQFMNFFVKLGLDLGGV